MALQVPPTLRATLQSVNVLRVVRLVHKVLRCDLNDLYSYGLYSYGLFSYGLFSYGLYRRREGDLVAAMVPMQLVR